MKSWLAASVVLFLVIGTRVALATEPAPCGSTRPWILVVVAGDFPAGVAPFVALLRAELVSRGFDLCASTSREVRAPTATIEVVPKVGGLVLNVEVRDAVTAKRVSREIDLGAVPPDSQPLMVALAADELLRASWAELTLRSAPPPVVAVPTAVMETVRDSATPTSAPDRLRLGVVGTAQHHAAGTTLYGADVLFGVAWSSRVSTDLGFGLRTAPIVAAGDGDISTSAFAGHLSARVTVTPPDRPWGVDAVGRFEVERLAFAATPHTAALATSQSGYAVLAAAGAQAWLRVLRRLRIGAEVLADVPVRPVYVTDAQVRVAGVAGAGVGGGLGVWGAL